MFVSGLVSGALRALWWALVVLVVGAALLLTSARLLFTVVDEYQEQATDWAEARLGVGVEVERVDTGMHGLHFALVLGDIRLLDPAGGTVARFDELRLSLAGIASLRQRELVFGEVALSGAELDVGRDPDGRWHFGGVAGESGSSSGPGFGRLRDWLFSQQRLRLQDIRIRWRDGAGEAASTREWHVRALSLFNHDRRHQLEARLDPPAEMGGRLSTTAYFEGAGTDPARWNGTLHVEGEGLELGGLEVPGFPPGLEGRLDMAVWSDWRRGELVDGVGDLELADLRPGTAGSGFRGIETVSAELRLNQREGVFHFDLPWLRLGTADAELPPTQARVGVRYPESEGGASLALRLGELPVAPFLPWLDAVADSGPVAEIAAADPRGTLRAMALDYHPTAPPARRWAGHVEFDHLAWQPVHRLPGVDGLHGTAWLDPRGGVADLRLTDGELALPELAREPWPVSAAALRIDWRHGTDGFWLRGRDLTLQNADLGLRGRLGLHLPGSGRPPFVDLGLRVGRVAAEAIPRYLPTGILPSGTVKWLDQAFLDGETRGGEVVVHGRVERGRFPWPEQREGRLAVDTRVAGVAIRYHPAWPVIDEVDGDLAMRGRSMAAEIDGGRFESARIGATRIAIDDFKAARVELEGDARGDAGAFARYLQGMPLKEKLAVQVDRLDGSGPLALSLSAEVPLGRTPGEPRYRGVLDAGGAATLTYGLGTHRVAVEEVEGRVTFSPSTIVGDAIRGRLFDGPATVDIRGDRTDGALVVKVDGQGEMRAPGLAPYLAEWLHPRIEGTAGWRLRAGIDPERGFHGRLESSLLGLALDLPHPLEKSGDEPRPTRLEWQSAERTLSLRHGNVFDSLGHWRGEGPTLGIHLGHGNSDIPDRGVRVTGVLDNLDLGAWGRLVPRSEEVEDEWAPAWSDWDLARVSVALERLHLYVPEREPGELVPEPGPLTRLRPEHLPPLSIRVDDLRRGDARLGALVTASQPSGRGVRFPLRLGDNKQDLQGEMVWNGERHTTSLNADLNVSDTGRWMKKGLALPAFLQDGRLESELDLTWAGGPSDFHLRRVQGTAEFEIVDGRLLEVKPGAGRALGLFSLRSLPRRFGLDFSDLFGEGLAFDRMHGTFELRDGNALIDEMLIDSSVARIRMTGRTGLVARDHDQRITVIPGDGTHFFLPGALIWGPQAGALIWLGEKVLQLDQVTRYTYRVTGSWDDPHVERVGTRRE
ncbi:MAG: YhdP family protein [Pseudomonadota bacterium]